MTTAAGCQLSRNGDIYVASGSADSTVKIWHIVDTAGTLIKYPRSSRNSSLLVTCLHTLDLKNGFAITLELIPLDTHPGGKSISLHKKISLNMIN